MSGRKRPVVPIGRITGTHGLRGALKVRTHPGDAAALLAVDRVWLQAGEDGDERRQVEAAAPRRGEVVLQLAGCRHISQAAALVGTEIAIDPADLDRQPGEFYWFELAGLAVKDLQRGDIGSVTDLFFTAAHGILVVDGEVGEVLLPLLDQFVKQIDAEVVLVDVPEGLFPDR